MYFLLFPLLATVFVIRSCEKFKALDDKYLVCQVFLQGAAAQQVEQGRGDELLQAQRWMMEMLPWDFFWIEN